MKNSKEIRLLLEEEWQTYKNKLYNLLSPTQVRIIQRRIFNKKSFQELGIRYNQNALSVQLLFDWSVKRIRERLNRDFADRIDSYNRFLNNRRVK